MLMYNLIENSDYSRTSGGLCQYHSDEPNDNLMMVILKMLK